MKKDAIISECNLYRYILTRIWDENLRKCVFIMLNPSTADANLDDPTIRRCINFAKRENCGSLTVVNVSAYRATSPQDIGKNGCSIGPENINYINDITKNNDALIIVAWGTNVEKNDALLFYRVKPGDLARGYQ